MITYSGIADKRVEPIDSEIAAESLKQSFAAAKSYRTIFYWRPVVPFLNDSDEHLARALELSHHAHATVFTGLFYREQMASYFRERGIPEPYDDVARRKIMPRSLDARIVECFGRRTGSAFYFARRLVALRSRMAYRTTMVTLAFVSCVTSAQPVSYESARVPGGNRISRKWHAYHENLERRAFQRWGTGLFSRTA